jgi:hypothetical protein
MIFLGTTGSDGVAYVRKKRVGKYEYYQLVEGKRVDGKVRQRVIAHLGKHDSIEAARLEVGAAASVVPKDKQPAKPKKTVEAALSWPRDDAPPSEELPPESDGGFYRVSPDILNADDAVLRKMRKRLRAAARRRIRRIEDAQAAAYSQGIALTDDYWRKIEGILQEAEHLSEEADKLTAELKRRR